MERLTKRRKDSIHKNGICCTHFNSQECYEVAGHCSLGCIWEEEVWAKLAHYEDLAEAGRLVELSEGYTVADLAYCTAYESCPKDLGLPLPFNCNMQSCKDCWETALKGGGQNE